MGDFFSIEKLKGKIGEDGYKQLEDAAIDKGQAFLSNQITSAFVSAGKTDIASTTIGAAATTIGAIQMAKTLTSSEAKEELVSQLQSIGVSIIAEGVSLISQEASKQIMLYTGKHAEAIKNMPKQILNYAMTYFNTYKMSVGDVVKELNANRDVYLEDNINKSIEQQQEEYKQRKQESREKIIKDILAYTQKVNDTMNTIVDYIAEGPTWIVDRIDTEVKGASQYIEKKLDKQWKENDKPGYDAYAKQIGEAKGKNMVDAYNNTLKKAQRKIMAKMEAAKSKGETKIKSTLKIKILGIAAKTGIL